MPLARGGMGQVWVARLSGTRGFQKLVAIKTILPTGEESVEKLEMMLFEEASLASRIRHPNVAEILDLGEQTGTLYLVMEWVNGEALDYILRVAETDGGRLPISVGVHLLEQACRGLHCAHEARDENGAALKIVHRDISPQNLLVTYSGALKLIDFGVAKATQQISAATEIGQVKGKFAYMSPEQIQGDPLDARADLFAMGVVLYRATTGVHPYKGDHPAHTVRNILLGTPTLPSDIVPDYPKVLEQVVMKALARDRADRFASAEEMGIALDRSLPLALRANGAKETDTYLRKHFASRIGERSQALRGALGAVDRGRQLSDGKLLLSGFPRSQSTMRAVSIDSDGPEIIIGEADDIKPHRAGRLRRRMTAGSLALVAGLAAYLVSQPRLPHFRFAKNAAPASGQAVSLPPPAVPSAPPSETRPAPEQATPAETAPEASSAKAKAPAPVRAPARKRDRIRRPETTDSRAAAPAPASAAAPAPTPASAPADAHAVDGDPLSRQK
jgi:serine/threonine-protein kinase